MADELDPLRELGRELADLDPASEIRARELLQRHIDTEGRGRRRARPRRVRWAVVVAGAIVIGSGLGFGVRAWTTEDGRGNVTSAGLGFLPTPGWTVVQSGAAGPTKSSNAIAANVELDADDDSHGIPYATLRRLPARGLVIVARFSPRGDELLDARYPLRPLPLRVRAALPADLMSTLAETSLVSFRLRQGVAGYNVAVSVFFGSAPTRTTIAAVDRQLRRLVVAADGITLVVQPRVMRTWSEPLTIFGSVSDGKADQKVTIQFKACGVHPIQFRDAFETTTRDGGGYTLSGPGAYRPPGPGVSGVFRAVSGDSVSAEVPVQQRASISLRPRDGGRTFQIFASGKVSFWRKVVLLQRFERRRGVWITMRRLRLSDSVGSSGLVGTPHFRPAVPKGTLIRAVLPLSQARPCYLAGSSRTWRT